MIKGDMKTHMYEIEGIKPQVMTEVTTLLHTLYDHGMFTKDDIYRMAELACMSNEDVHDKAMNQLDSTITTVMDKMFDDATHGKQEAIDALAMLTDMMLKDIKDMKDKG